MRCERDNFPARRGKRVAFIGGMLTTMPYGFDVASHTRSINRVCSSDGCHEENEATKRE
jgi:hypothetical protein